MPNHKAHSVKINENYAESYEPYEMAVSLKSNSLTNSLGQSGAFVDRLWGWGPLGRAGGR